MLLSKILADLQYSTVGEQIAENTEVSDIIYDSRKAKSGTMFVCLVGAVSDGHNFASSAYRNGCRIFMVERELELPGDALQIIVEDTREGLAYASAAFFEYPARSLMVIGITGTKGKTTTASLIADILNKGGINTAYIGTTGISFCGEHRPTKNTTPESYELHKAFSEMVNSGVTSVVMEVSSQAMYMKRVAGIRFHIGVFTNLSHDHIGGVEHPTFEHYMSCKAELFRQCRYGIFNSDDPHYTEMLKTARSINSTFGTREDIAHDVSARELKITKSGNVFGIEFVCRTLFGEHKYELRMPGEFNVYNALAAISVAERMQIPGEIIADALSTATVKGRFEIVDALPGAVTIIDYAHNALSMNSALETIRKYEPMRLVVLFGSVGGRSQMRRAELGEIAAKLADFCIITSDNPDSENPDDIIADIEKVVAETACPYITITDREEAVRYAIDNARDGDCILFAGKGHEEYQLINGENVPYSEREAIHSAAAERLARVR